MENLPEDHRRHQSVRIENLKQYILKIEKKM